VTDATQEHAHFDELAAGFALHALDPDDEQQFLAHLATCPRCRDALSDFTEVAAALADDWSAVEPSPLLGQRIMAAIAESPPAGVTDLSARRAQSRDSAESHHPDQARSQPRHRSQRQHHRRLVTIASAAAAAVLVAGGAVWGGLAATGGSTTSVAGHSGSCLTHRTCPQVVLTDSRTHATAGQVMIVGQTVWLVPSGLPADNEARHVYVLWQITGAHTPLAVGSFDVRGHADQAVRIGSLAVPYHGTWAFAVSLEPGRTIPAHPSHPVALGQVTS
jgi:anti-sigma-K factor RskA